MNIVFESPIIDGSDAMSSTHTNVGLPGHYYFSYDVFVKELRSLWCNTWQMVGRVSDLPNPGDYLTCTIGDQPLFVIRTENGELRALHNVCPHRSARLLDGQGHCNKQVRCPYHAWRFDLDGNLLGLPQSQYFQGLDKASVHLLAARVDTWGGFIFVNLAPQGESLQSHLAGFPAYLKQYEQPWEDLQEVDRWCYEEPVNWKFPIENYLECYHLPIVHGKSLQCFDPTDIRQTPTGRHFQIFVPFTQQESVREHRAFSGEPQTRSYQGFIFPNWMVNTAKDKVSVFRVVPLTPTTTRFEVLIYQTLAQQEAFPYNADDFRPEFDRVLQEDLTMVRSLQSSVHSIAYGVTQLADIEFGIAHFHQNLAEYLRE
jgi:phenylpropionate dioxygenase-like ring-hydroxylating dioxygenase large terminal subunit